MFRDDDMDEDAELLEDAAEETYAVFPYALPLDAEVAPVVDMWY